MNKKYLIFMLSLLLCGQVESASAARRVVRALDNKIFMGAICIFDVVALPLAGYAHYCDWHEKKYPVHGPLPMSLEYGGKFDMHYSKLVLWAQDKVGVPLKKRTFVLVGDISKRGRRSWAAACCCPDHIFVDKKKFVGASPYWQRISMLHEAIHVKQRNEKGRCVVLDKDRYKNIEEEAGLEAAKYGRCYLCTRVYSRGKIKRESRPYDDENDYRYKYAKKEDFEPIIKMQEKEGLLCDEHLHEERKKRLEIAFDVVAGGVLLSEAVFLAYLAVKKVVS